MVEMWGALGQGQPRRSTSGYRIDASYVCVVGCGQKKYPHSVVVNIVAGPTSRRTSCGSAFGNSFRFDGLVLSCDLLPDGRRVISPLRVRYLFGSFF